ncbi:MAG: outer membrane channel protein [Gammaproteobacteria bacterium]|nr:MAG: outer membrane channel protein [Gammaproteobacteria bacterium]TND02890.1 MAG: outer membrane channel protein [Gammaproteobacteria bacterium]
MTRRIISSRSYPAILFALTLLPGLSTAASAEGVLDIYRLADQYDTQLQQAEAAYRASLEARPQSRAGLLPSVGISANTTWNEQDRTYPGNATFSGNEDFNSHGYSLNLTQPLYRHEAWVRYRQSQDTISGAEATLMTARQAMIVRAADRYFNVLAATDNLQFATAEKDAIKRQLEQTQQRFEVGLIAITDVLEAQASYDTAVAQEIEANNLLATSREVLRELTGRNHEIIAPLRADTPLVTPAPADIDAWTEKSLENSLALRAAEFAYDAARKEVAAQRAGHYPTLDAVASRSNTVSDGGSFGKSDIDDTRIGLQLNMSLFQGGLVASQTRQARQGAEQASQAMEQQRRGAIRQTREAYLGVLAAISRVTAFKQARASSQSALEATEAGYDVGTRTTVDVLLARRTVFLAQRDYARSRYDYILNSLRLKQAVGTLSPADLEQVNAWLAN